MCPVMLCLKKLLRLIDWCAEGVDTRYRQILRDQCFKSVSQATHIGALIGMLLTLEGYRACAGILRDQRASALILRNTL